MTTDQIERRARCLHSDAVAAEGGIGLAREELSVVPHTDIDQTGRLVLGAAAREMVAKPNTRLAHSITASASASSGIST